MPELLMWQTAALLCGFILDFFIGDPHCIPHPGLPDRKDDRLV